MESLIIGDTNKISNNILLTNETYHREDLNLVSQELHNIDIPFNKSVTIFRSVLYQYDSLVTYCDLHSVCQPPMDFYHKTISNLTYGFSDDSAYYSAEYFNEDDDMIRTEDFRFNIKGNHVEYEILILDYEESTFGYTIFYNNQYRAYRYYSNEDVYSFEYSNLDTFKYFLYKKYDEGTENIVYYNPDTEYLLQQNNSFTIAAKYDGIDWVARLEKYDTDYVASFNLNYIEAWDSLIHASTGDSIYNNGVEVYADYDVYVHDYFLVLTRVYIRSELGQAVGDYTFPEAFSGDVTVNELSEYITNLEDSDYILNLLDLTREDIYEQCMNKFDEYLN